MIAKLQHAVVDAGGAIAAHRSENCRAILLFVPVGAAARKLAHQERCRGFDTDEDTVAPAAGAELALD